MLLLNCHPGEEEVDGPGQDDDVVRVGEERHHGRTDPNAWRLREQSCDSGYSNLRLQ